MRRKQHIYRFFGGRARKFKAMLGEHVPAHALNDFRIGAIFQKSVANIVDFFGVHAYAAISPI